MLPYKSILRAIPKKDAKIIQKQALVKSNLFLTNGLRICIEIFKLGIN